MKDSTVLKKARKLITENGHCKGVSARNKYRHAVSATSKSAVRFCASGAIVNVLDGLKNSQGWWRVARWLEDEARGCKVEEYNDLPNTTLQDIDEWFARAIKRAKNSESYY